MNVQTLASIVANAEFAAEVCKPGAIDELMREIRVYLELVDLLRQ